MQGEALAAADNLIKALVQEVEALRAVVTELMPKAAAFDRIANAGNSHTVTNAAKILQIMPSRLYDWLGNNRWTYRSQGRPTAHQERIEQGFLVVKDYFDRPVHFDPQIFITAKGMATIAILLNKQGGCL